MYIADAQRYEEMKYNRCGNSGLKLPALSLGFWHNFGDCSPISAMREMMHRSFDLGITHFDLANNYGPPPGSAELNFGKIFAQDFSSYRDELIISTKAGYRMHPGPYGEWGSRKYLLSSLDASLKRMNLEYVDIFYSHRFDPDTPLEETVGALETAVRQGKALYAGISSYSASKTREAWELLRQSGVPCTIHQPSYSMLNRWIEEDLLETLGELGIGCICFSPLAQGMLTSKYLRGIPEGSRASGGENSFLPPSFLSKENLERISKLNSIAERRGQSLAQMALAWCLRKPEITSVLIGARSARQISENAAALNNLSFSDEEMKEIDRYAKEGEINIWRQSSTSG